MKLSHLVVLLIISIGPLSNVSKGFFVVWISIFAAWMLGFFKKIKNPATTTGKVVKITRKSLSNDNLIGTVEYIVDGKTYIHKFNSPTIYMNSKKCIQYSKDNPEISRLCPTVGRYMFAFVPLVWGLSIIYADLFIH